jgi:replicative DNA helicase
MADSAVEFRRPSPNSRAREGEAPVRRELPVSEEAEQHVIACCLLDGSDTVARCLEARLAVESFYLPAHPIIF